MLFVLYNDCKMMVVIIIVIVVVSGAFENVCLLAELFTYLHTCIKCPSVTFIAHVQELISCVTTMGT